MKILKSSMVVLALLIFQISKVNAYSDDNIKDGKYETYKIHTIKSINLDDGEYTPEEVKKDLLEEANINYLKNKTDDKYEIAMASSNGEYTYVKSLNNLKDAIKEVNKIKSKQKKFESDIPVIINEKGIVVYATESIGRLTRLVDGVASQDKRYNVNIYSSATSKTAITYLNHGYLDDMPILEQTETRVKVEVNGVTGWIDKEEGNITNVVQVPLNQAKNLSYYKKSGEDLVHYISSDITGNSGYSNIIGKAPFFMKENVKYYSYDGNYFYTDISKLLSDAEAGNHNNSVNAKDVFYNYYLYLPGRTKTSYTAKDITNYLNNNTPSDSILRNRGYEFIQAQEKYGVNASLIVGVAMNESGRGTSSIAKSKNNIFGLNAVDLSPGESANYFKTIEECVNEFASYWMSKGYFNPSDWRYGGSSLGNKGFGINIRYASDPYWGEKAASYMYDMDKYINNGILKEYNKYNLGIFKSKSSVINSNGVLLYTGEVGSIVPILSKNDDFYKINGDRQNSSSPLNGNYSWTNEAIVSKSSIKEINSSYSGALNQNQISVINNFEKFYIYGPIDNPTIDLSNKSEKITTVSQASNILKKTLNGKKYDRQKYLDAWNALSAKEKSENCMQEIKTEYLKIISITEATEACLSFYEDIKENTNNIISKPTLAISLNSKNNKDLGARGSAYKEYNEAIKHGENSKNSERMSYINKKYLDTVNFLEVIELLNENNSESATIESNKIIDSTLKSEALRAIKLYEESKHTTKQENVFSKFRQFYIYGPMDNPSIDLSNKSEKITTASQATNILKKIVDGKKYDRQKYLDAWNALSTKEKSEKCMQEIKTEYLKIISITEASEACLSFYEKVVESDDKLMNNYKEVLSLNSKDNKLLGARGSAYKEYNEATKHGENSKNSDRMHYINQKYLDTVNFLDALICIENGDLKSAKVKVDKIKDERLLKKISLNIN